PARTAPARRPWPRPPHPTAASNREWTRGRHQAPSSLPATPRGRRAHSSISSDDHEGPIVVRGVIPLAVLARDDPPWAPIRGSGRRHGELTVVAAGLTWQPPLPVLEDRS